MRLKRVYNDVSFTRNLTKSEIGEYSEILKQGKALSGQTGKSVFIMPSSCLPQSENFNSGIGHLTSDIAQSYIDYMKSYLDFNAVEDLPAGQIRPHNGFYCAYNSSSFALGNHQINPELLVQKKYANLLSKEDLKQISDANYLPEKSAISNFYNVMDENGAQNQALKKAFKKFKQLKDDTPLKQKYKTFLEENSFWLNFPREDEPSSEFFKFKQFLADEHLKDARKKLNSKGIKLYGDCPIGFSYDEVKAFPNAFKKDCCIGLPQWGLPALNYDEILDDTSDASKLLKQKVQLYAKRYDSIRFDAAWSYVTPVVSPRGTTKIKPEYKKELDAKLLEKIERWVKEVKGEDFDLKDLIYEFDAGPDEFTAFKEGKLISPLRGRTKMYHSTYMHHTNRDAWGYNKAYLDRGFSPDEFILGVGNHDPQPLRQIAKGIPDEVAQGVFEDHKKGAIRPLSETLNIPEEKLENPVEFAKAKWADVMTAKNNQYFYMDVFGREERFDMQWQNTKVHPEKNYAYKVPADYKTAYQKGVQEGFGFNPMDSLEKVFKAKGLNETNPDLYGQIVKYNKILQDPNEIVENLPDEIIENIPKKKGALPKAALIAGGICAIGVSAYLIIKNYLKKPKSNVQIKDEFIKTAPKQFYTMNDFINEKITAKI